MGKSIFISLAVADLARAERFYAAIGCTRDERFSGAHAASYAWSDQITFMLATHDFYQTLTPKRIIDARTETGALFALPFDSREAVDDFMARALAAGGREAHDAEDDGFMYQRAVEDPDGHGFGPMWMDTDAAVAAMADARANQAA